MSLAGDPIQSGICHRCHMIIHLIPAGQHHKWVTSPARPGSWRCGNDPNFPVLTHSPAP